MYDSRVKKRKVSVIACVQVRVDYEVSTNRYGDVVDNVRNAVADRVALGKCIVLEVDYDGCEVSISPDFTEDQVEAYYNRKLVEQYTGGGNTLLNGGNTLLNGGNNKND